MQARAGRGALRSAAPCAGRALGSRAGRAACAPIGAAAALLRPSQLASAAARDGQDLFPWEGGSRARAALAGVVWGRGEEGAGSAPCICPAGGAGRSQPDGPGISCVWLRGVSVGGGWVCAPRAGVSLPLKKKQTWWGGKT